MRFQIKNDTDKTAAQFLHRLMERDPSVRSRLVTPVQVVSSPKLEQNTRHRCPRCGWS